MGMGGKISALSSQVYTPAMAMVGEGGPTLSTWLFIYRIRKEEWERPTPQIKYSVVIQNSKNKTQEL